jgi:hypothetical protein
MRETSNHRAAPAIAAATLFALLLLLGACSDSGAEGGVASLDGGTTDDSTGGGGADEELTPEEQEEALLDWSACMRDEGVDIPDPEISEDGGIMLGGPRQDGEDGDDGGQPPLDLDAMEEAQEVCGDPPMIGGELSEEELQERQDEALAFSECMRDEGITDFPDPDLSQQGPGGPATRSSADDEDGGDVPDGPRIVGPWGEIDLSDPEMSDAFEACQEELGGVGPGAGGPPGGGAGASSEEG